MGQIIHSCSNVNKVALSKPIRGIPENFAITATRIHGPELNQLVLDIFTAALPQGAAQFFSEGIQEVVRLNYPGYVLTVIQEYHNQWAKRPMH